MKSNDTGIDSLGENIPEYVKHILHTHADRQRETWCGIRHFAGFAFEDAHHAAYEQMNGGRLLPCKRCVRAFIDALRLHIKDGDY